MPNPQSNERLIACGRNGHAPRRTHQLAETVNVFGTDDGWAAKTAMSGRELCSADEPSDVLETVLQFLSEAGGGSVQLAPAVFELRRPLRPPSGVRVHGSGPRTVLQPSPDFDAGQGGLIELSEVDQAELAHMTLRSDGGEGVSTGVCLTAAGGVDIKGIDVVGFRSYGVRVSDSSFLVRLDSCRLADNGKAHVYFDEQADGRGGFCVPNVVSNCITYRGGTGLEAKHSTVLNVLGMVCYQPQWHGLYLHSRSNSVLVSGCRTFQCGSTAIVIAGSHEANISSNIFCWQRGDGIEIRDAHWANVTANNVIDTGVRDLNEVERVGIRVTGSSRGAQVVGNQIFNWGDQTIMAAGVHIDPTATDTSVVANSVNYTREPALRFGTDVTCAHNVVNPDDPYDGPADTPFPDFDTTRIERFIRSVYHAQDQRQAHR